VTWHKGSVQKNVKHSTVNNDTLEHVTLLGVVYVTFKSVTHRVIHFSPILLAYFNSW